MYCVYCGKDHGEGVKFTDGHVVPSAIGGSNALTIGVCSASDNSLGGRVEKPFIESFPVNAQRFFLGLAGTDGTEPTLDLGGEKQIDGKKVRVDYTITKDSSELRIAPAVTKRPTADGEHWTVSGDPRKVRQILEGKLKSLDTNHKQMKSEAGELLTIDSLGALIDSARVGQVRPGIVKRIDFDLLACYQCFVKMALSMGHLVLGESFSRSAGADILRAAMYASDLSTARIPHSFVWPYIDGAERLFAPFRIKDTHVLGILDGVPPVFIASLFGNYDAFIPLAPIDGLPKPSSQGRVFQIELPSRRVHERTLLEYLAAVVAARRRTQGQSNN